MIVGFDHYPTVTIWNIMPSTNLCHSIGVFSSNLLLSHICEKGLSVGLFVTVNLVGAHKKHSFLD